MSFNVYSLDMYEFDETHHEKIISHNLDMAKICYDMSDVEMNNNKLNNAITWKEKGDKFLSQSYRKGEK